MLFMAGIQGAMRVQSAGRNNGILVDGLIHRQRILRFELISRPRQVQYASPQGAADSLVAAGLGLSRRVDGLPPCLPASLAAQSPLHVCPEKAQAVRATDGGIAD